MNTPMIEIDSLSQADKPLLKLHHHRFGSNFEQTKLPDATLIVSFHISRNCRFDFLSLFHVAQY